MSEEQFLNPDSWTEKELLKHLYRQARDQQIQLDNIKKELEETNKLLSNMEIKLIKLETEVTEREKEIDRRMNRNNTISAVIGTIIGGAVLLWEIFKGGS